MSNFFSKTLCLVAGLFLIVISGSAAPNRVTATIDTARRAPMRQNGAHPATSTAVDIGIADPAMRIEYASLMLRSSPGLEIFLAEQQNPASPNFRHWLAPEEFADRFGASPSDLAQIRKWLENEGLRVNDIARGGLWITFSGTAAQVNRTFRTQLHRYRSGSETHFSYATGLSIPVALEPLIDSVAGLDDFAPAPMYRAMDESSPDYNSGNSHYLSPGDLAAIYNVKSLYNAGIGGAGQKIAVLGRTDLDLSDVRAFRRLFNLPANDPQVILFGPDPGSNSGDQSEANLDLQWAGAVARDATILYVNSTDVRLSAQYAVDQNLAPVMTYSYGSCEQYTSDTLRGVAQQANAQGITWLVSSGDALSAECDRTSPIPLATRGLTASYPATIPEITAVGGTQFNEGAGTYWNRSNDGNLTSALSYIPELPWNGFASRNGIVGGGGGASAFYSKPSWQSGPGVPADKARDIPDISLTASPDHVGYLVYINGVLRVFGGTSASAPSFAGIVALLNQSLNAAQPGVGNINPTLYRLAQSSPDAFHDVTEGDIVVGCQQGSPNCVDGKLGYAAGAGYDLASGLGSVDAARLVSVWNSGTVSTTAVTSSSLSLSPSDRLQLMATVTGASGAPTGTVTFLTNDIVLGTVQLIAGAGSSTASLDVAAALVLGGNGVIFAAYSGDSVYAISDGQIPTTAKQPEAGSFVVPSITPYPVTPTGTSWPYTLRLVEKAGVATTVTVFTVDGVNNLSNLPNPALAANGSIALSLAGRNLTVPTTRAFHFEGSDADGRKWTADISAPFVGPTGPSLAPSVTLSALPANIQQNAAADPGCRWQAQLILQERTGFSVVFSSLSINGLAVANFAQLFGTNRLAAYGTLRASYCFPEGTLPGSKTVILLAQDERGGAVTVTGGVTLSAAAAAPAAFSVAAPSVSLSTPVGSDTATGSIDLTFAGGSPAGSPVWTATVVSQSPWLTPGSSSGTGSGSLSLKASAAGLSRGAYAATVVIQATGALPQSIVIPVFLTVAPSTQTAITGVSNAASFVQAFAPGMLLAVFGNNLAPALASAAIQPLPYALQGVSATVNGISAPLWFISPGQLNIQIPYETTSGPAILAVNNNGEIASWVLSMGVTAPGVFADSSLNLVPFISGAAGQTVVAYVTGDGDVTPSLATGTSPASGTLLSRLPASRQSVSITVNGVTAKIAFNGIVPGLIGVTQINFTVPENLSPGVYPVVVTAGGVASAPVNFTVK